ncbi:MAG TPA: methyl-accepting chemotaxis protein [Dictyobacter sp.]|jgi:methyl-accepting chemotaxis protein|nr:methyl-accepting chemotaxis protein [Dictyobacter sp.]
MNPDQNKSGMTVNSLLNMGLWVSAVVPIFAFVIIAFILTNFNLDHTTFSLAVSGCAVVVVIVVLITNYYMKRNVTGRIASLLNVSREFVGGDRSVRATVNGDDEFAQLSSTLNTVLDNQGTVTATSVGGGSDAAALQAQIEKLLQEVSAVGDGDLRVQAEVTPDTLGVLADSFNYMIEELAKVVGRVQSTAVQVTNATRRILDRSAELATASETQVKQIANTTEAVEALAVFIQHVARNAQLSVEVAQEALHSATNGQQAVRQSIEGMLLIRENVQETSKKIKRLGERSNEIGEIVRIIEDIADQTNLLALNAAIQSAMAGEHGRGFAVVADEIRLLAERSTESTKRIATLVKSIQGDTYEAVVAMEDSTQEVVKGSQLADDAGRSLNSIYSAVERQAQMIENIARAANEQTSVSEAVAVAMGRISEITRQTDAGTQEAAVSVSYLAELSEQLRASVSTFRLPDRASDMLGGGSFGGGSASGINEGADQNAQIFGSSLPGMDGGSWSQGLANSFPPLPEPGNSGSLVSMGSRSNGFPSNGQQADFGQGMSQPGMNAPFGAPANFGNGQPMNQGMGNQPFFGNGNQMDFGDMSGFDGQMQSANQGFGGQAFPSLPGGAAPNQQFVQSSNPGLLPPPMQQQPGQPMAARPHWPNSIPQDQNP